MSNTTVYSHRTTIRSHTIPFTSLHISLHEISCNSGILSGITWKSCTKIAQKVCRAGIRGSPAGQLRGAFVFGLIRSIQLGLKTGEIGRTADCWLLFVEREPVQASRLLRIEVDRSRLKQDVWNLPAHL